MLTKNTEGQNDRWDAVAIIVEVQAMVASLPQMFEAVFGVAQRNVSIHLASLPAVDDNPPSQLQKEISDRLEALESFKHSGSTVHLFLVLMPNSSNAGSGTSRQTNWCSHGCMLEGG